MTKAPDPDRSSLAAILVLSAAALALGAVAAALGALDIDPAVSESSGAANLASLVPLWIVAAISWAALSAVWFILLRPLRANREDHLRRFVASTVLVLVGAMSARTYVLFAHEPELSNDVYRYVYDGFNVATSENPYLVRPEDRVDVSDRDERWPGEALIAQRINHSELTTLYLPTSQRLFGLIATVASRMDVAPLQYEQWFRGAFVIAEVALMGLLACALRRRRRSAWWLVLYAWHPLPLTEIAGSGHQDVLGVALLVAAMLAFDAKRGATWLWSALLCAAALVKPIVLPIAPIMLRGQSIARAIVGLLAGAAVIFALTGPLLLTHNSAPLENLRATSGRFTSKWMHFGAAYELAYRGLDAIDPITDFHADWELREARERRARAICGAVLAAVVLVTIIMLRDAWRGAAIMLFAMVLLSPAAHPWYLLWALALMPIAPGVPIWIASLTITWGYAAWAYGLRDNGAFGWHVPTWVTFAAWSPVYAVLLVETVRRIRNNVRRDESRVCETGVQKEHGP